MIIAFISMFCSMFLSGFRSRSIAANFKWQASISGALQTAGELIATVALIKSPTVEVIASATLAAGLGYYLSMMFHDMVNKKHYKLQKRQRKQWVDHRIERRFAKIAHQEPVYAVKNFSHWLEKYKQGPGRYGFVADNKTYCYAGNGIALHGYTDLYLVRAAVREALKHRED